MCIITGMVFFARDRRDGVKRDQSSESLSVFRLIATCKLSDAMSATPPSCHDDIAYGVHRGLKKTAKCGITPHAGGESKARETMVRGSMRLPKSVATSRLRRSASFHHRAIDTEPTTPTFSPANSDFPAPPPRRTNIALCAGSEIPTRGAKSCGSG